MEAIGQGPSWACVACDEPLHRLHGYLGAAVCMGVISRGDPVVDTPGLQECSGGMGRKLWASVRGECVWDAKS